MLLLATSYKRYCDISLCYCLVPVITVMVTLVCVFAWCQVISLGCCLVPVITVMVTIVCDVAWCQVLMLL